MSKYVETNSTTCLFRYIRFHCMEENHAINMEKSYTGEKLQIRTLREEMIQQFCINKSFKIEISQVRKQLWHFLTLTILLHEVN